MAAGRRRIGLREGLEESRQRLVGDAGARVANRQLDDAVVGRRLQRRETHDDFALLGELDRVPDQVREDLAQPPRIAEQRGRQRVVDLEAQVDALAVRAVREQRADVLDDVAGIAGNRVELDLARLALREVEDVVDHLQELHGGLLDRLREAPLTGREVGIEEQVGHPDHTVHRRPDLVAHVRQELALRSVRILGEIRRLPSPRGSPLRARACVRAPSPRGSAAARRPAAGSCAGGAPSHRRSAPRRRSRPCAGYRGAGPSRRRRCRWRPAAARGSARRSPARARCRSRRPSRARGFRSPGGTSASVRALPARHRATAPRRSDRRRPRAAPRDAARRAHPAPDRGRSYLRLRPTTRRAAAARSSRRGRANRAPLRATRRGR